MELEINDIKQRISTWARTKPLIEKVYLFGSRLTGISFRSSEPARLNSDVDIAVEITREATDENHLATWICESDNWKKELMEILALEEGIKLDFQLYHPLETPEMDKYLQKASKVLYSSAERRLKELNSELNIIYHHLDMFKQVNEIIEKNEKLKKMNDWSLIVWMKRAFTSDLVIGLGRICDDNKKTNSLYECLRELKQNPALLARNRFVRLYGSDSKSAHRDFDELSGQGEDTYPIEYIEQDMKAIKEENPCKKIKDYRDKYVAHTDLDKMADKPKYHDLFSAYAVIEEVVKKYNRLVKASVGDLTPTPLGDLWEVLTVPWLDKI